MLNDKAAQIQLKAAEGKNMKAAASAEPDNILQKYLDGVRLLDKAGVDTLGMQDLKSAMFPRRSGRYLSTRYVNLVFV